MKEIINYFSHYFQDFEKGVNPIAGQIFGLLIQKSEPVSLAEIAEELELSKPAISIQIRTLSDLGYCVKLPRKSDRKDYYKINDFFLEQVYKNRIRRQEYYFEELNRILKSTKNTDRDQKNKLNAVKSLLKAQIDFQKRLLSEQIRNP
jgi:DNA-binding transcriptional regulator GbsR (MarR family)